MPNISTQELLDALQKSGAPFGNSAQMRQAAPFLGDTLSQNAYAANTQIPKYQQAYNADQGKYKSQIDQIAQMDQKLRGIYGNPTSNMYIANPAAQERAVTGHQTTDYTAAHGISQDANAQLQGIKSEQGTIDKQTNDALSLYAKLTAIQKSSEPRASRSRGGSSGGSGNVSDIPASNGIQDLSGMSKADQTKYLQETGKKITDPAGVYDREARDTFLNTPAAFQKYFISNVQDFGYPKGGYSASDIQSALATWTRKYGNKGGPTLDPSILPNNGLQIMQQGTKGKKTTTGPANLY